MTLAPGSSRQKLGGLLTRKERWGLSWRGWLALAVVVVLACGFILLNVQPFLTVTQRTDAKVLVVEGWVKTYVLLGAVQEFKQGGYQQVFTTGGPEVGESRETNDFNTSASVGAEELVRIGLPKESVQMVPAHSRGRDRTYTSAVALRQWFRDHHISARSINVLTEDAHARRTRLLFQEAFGDEYKVGIISIPDPDYEPARWWRSSEGVREILGESIAYMYAKFLFHPAPLK